MWVRLKVKLCYDLINESLLKNLLCSQETSQKYFYHITL